MLLILIIAISLSMDAFSLALAYGMYNFTKKEMVTLSIIVGMYHFFMPLLGMNFGNFLFKYIEIKSNLIVSLIFILIGIEMIIDSFKNEEKKKITGYIEMLSFGLAVSIDSFTTGISITSITNKYFISFIIFSITSLIFTYLGLNLGKTISNKIGKVSSIIGAIILLIIGVSYIFK